MNEELSRAADALGQATTVALACHVNPDADALGSMLGLAHHLHGMGKQTVCSFPNEPFDPPRWVEMLPGGDELVPPRAFPKEPPVMVTCDAASMDRLGMLAPAAVRSKTLIWIDHHVTILCACGPAERDIVEIKANRRGVAAARRHAAHLDLRLAWSFTLQRNAGRALGQ